MSARRRRAAALPVDGSPAGRPPRRQWGRFAIGLSVSLLGGWLFAALYLSAGGRKPVIVVNRDVEQYEVIEEGDLATERVAAGERASTIPGDEIDDIVGHRAATDLTPGMVLSERHLVANERELLDADEAAIGALLSHDDAPPDLSGGDLVDVVIVSDASDVDDDVTTVQGWVLDVRRPDDRTGDPGDRIVQIVVDQRDADEVQAAAHENRLAVAAVGRGDQVQSEVGDQVQDQSQGQ